MSAVGPYLAWPFLFSLHLWHVCQLEKGSRFYNRTNAAHDPLQSHETLDKDSLAACAPGVISQSDQKGEGRVNNPAVQREVLQPRS